MKKIHELLKETLENDDFEAVYSLLENRESIDSEYLLPRVLYQTASNMDTDYVGRVIGFVQKNHPELLAQIINNTLDHFIELITSPQISAIHAPYEMLYDASGYYIDRDMAILKIENPLLHAIRCILDNQFVAQLDPEELNCADSLLWNAFKTMEKTNDYNLELIRYFLHSESSPLNHNKNIAKHSGASYQQSQSAATSHLFNSSAYEPKITSGVQVSSYQWSKMITCSHIVDYCAYHPEMKGVNTLVLDMHSLGDMLKLLDEDKIEKTLKIFRDKKSNLYQQFDTKELKKNEIEVLIQASHNTKFNALHFALESDLMPVKFSPHSKYQSLFKNLCFFGYAEHLKYLFNNYGIKPENRLFLKTIKSWNVNSLEYFMNRNKDLKPVREINEYISEESSVREEKKNIERALSNDFKPNKAQVIQKKSHKV